MYCKYCGSELEEQAKFCVKCGEQIAPAASAAESAPKPAAAMPTTVAADNLAMTSTAKYRKPILFGAVLVVIALIMIGMNSFRGGSSQSNPSATVKSFMKAAGKHDFDAMMKLVPPDARPEGADLKLAKEMLNYRLKENKVEIVSFKILDVNKSESSATVRYMVQISRDGEKDEPEDDSIDLVRIGKKWYIEEDSLGF
ncbi:zinc-ribbon domain-containing protein [Paenibacillus sp. D51F]